MKIGNSDKIYIQVQKEDTTLYVRLYISDWIE